MMNERELHFKSINTSWRLNQFELSVAIKRLSHAIEHRSVSLTQLIECCHTILLNLESTQLPWKSRNALKIILEFVQANDTEYLRIFSEPKRLKYSIKDIDRLILDKILSENYFEAITFLESSNFSSLTPLDRYIRAMKIYMLSKNYRNVAEIDYRITGFVKSCGSFQIDKKMLIESKLITMMSLYLQDLFFDSLNYFIRLLTEYPALIQSLSDTQSDTSGIFITNQEIIMAITFSLLVSIPLNNYNDCLHLTELSQFFQISPMLVISLNLLIETKYHSFFHLCDTEFKYISSQNYFLDLNWDYIYSILRGKIYLFYLRFSNKIEIVYLSKVLGIKYDRIKSEIAELISRYYLNFIIDENDVITYKNINSMKNLFIEMKDINDKFDKKIQDFKNKNNEIRTFIQQTHFPNNNLQSSSTERKPHESDEQDEFNAYYNGKNNIIEK